MRLSQTIPFTPIQLFGECHVYFQEAVPRAEAPCISKSKGKPLCITVVENFVSQWVQFSEISFLKQKLLLAAQQASRVKI